MFGYGMAREQTGNANVWKQHGQEMDRKYKCFGTALQRNGPLIQLFGNSLARE
jgi:hypothetical protein